MIIIIIKLSAIILALGHWFVSAAPTYANEESFLTVMTGSQEEPGPGDSDGRGLAFVQLDSDDDMICYALIVRNITLPASGAHIHHAAVGSAGPVVVPLEAPDSSGRSFACMQVSSELIDAIMEDPDEYYVNIHNSAYPDGAVRGQLNLNILSHLHHNTIDDSVNLQSLNSEDQSYSGDSAQNHDNHLEDHESMMDTHEPMMEAHEDHMESMQDRVDDRVKSVFSRVGISD